MNGLFISANANGELEAHHANDIGQPAIPIRINDGVLSAAYINRYIPAKLKDGRLVLSPWNDLNSEEGERYTNGSVYAAAVAADKVYAGGSFTHIGQAAASRVAILDGEVGEWTPLDTESGIENGEVYALAASGSTVYIAGNFQTVDGQAMTYITKWNGSSFSDLEPGDWHISGGAGAGIFCLALSGSTLYAGGNFTVGNSPGLPVPPGDYVTYGYIAKYTGSSWANVAGQDSWLANGYDRVTAVYDILIADSKIYAGGRFMREVVSSLDYNIVNNIAWTDGSNRWQALGNGFNYKGFVYGLCELDGDIYAIGSFTVAYGPLMNLSDPDNITLNGLGRWDGSSWHPVGDFSDTGGKTICSDGQYIYAGGNFTNVGNYLGDDAIGLARYNFSSERWAAMEGASYYLGNTPICHVAEVLNNLLYVGGLGVVTWDGSDWERLGGDERWLNGSVSAITWHNGNLYAGGDFTRLADGESCERIAKFSGSVWSQLGSGFNNTVYALESWDGKLYAGGYFTGNAADEKTLARLAVYDPAEDDWATLGGGLNIKYSVPVHALKGRAEGLYIGGDFDCIGGALTANYLAGYSEEDGWFEMSACEEGISITAGPSETALTNDGVYAIGNWRSSYPTVYYRLACWDGEIWNAIESDYTQFRGIASDGSSVFVGTYNDTTGEYHVAEYDGSNWQELGGVFNRNANALTVDSKGIVFVAASGTIEIDGETGYNCIAQWYDNQWLKLGSGLTGNSPLANALAIDDDDNLYVGGRFTQAGVVDALNVCLLEEDGTLSNLGAGLDGTVKALLVDGSNIIAGGDFSGHVAAYINEEWTDLGAGLDGTVRALAIWDDKIYAGGKFETSGEITVNNIAVFSGSNWQALGAGLNGKVTSLAAGQAGVYAAGGFRHSGEVELNHVGYWDGDEWFTLGDGLNDEVAALAVYNDETHHKELVYAAGNFQFAGAVSVSRIVVYDGTAWQALGTGLDGPATALVVDENSGNLFAAGNFTQAGGVPVAGSARWDGEEWFAVGDGLDSTVSNLHFINDDLYAVNPDGVYRLDGDNWTEIYSYVDARINCLAGLDNDIVMGGTFSRIAGVDALRVAMWDGINWHALGGGFDGNISSQASCLLWHEGILYACGNFEIPDGLGGVAHAAYWDGEAWYPIGSGTVGEHYNQMVWYGDKLYIRTTASEVFTWDGENFERFKGGYYSVMENSEGLIFGLNSYRQPADIEARNIALWDGSEYHALGAGVNGRVHTIEEHNGEIYIGGVFTRTYNTNPLWLKYVAKWNAAEQKWEPVAGGLPGTVLKLRSLDARMFACTGGHGVYELVEGAWVRYDKYCREKIRGAALFAGELVVCGEFGSIVGLGPATLVRWDGNNWEIIAQGQYQYSAIEDLCTDSHRVIAAGSQWHCPEFGQNYGQVRVGEIFTT